MNATKIQSVRATIVSLRGEMLDLPRKRVEEHMTDGDLQQRLSDFGHVLDSVAAQLAEVEAEIERDKEYS